MFKFLMDRVKGKLIVETQRQTATRALSELNDILGGLQKPPMVTIDLASGRFEVILPEQMPDEALALPSPDQEPEAAENTAEAQQAA